MFEVRRKKWKIEEDIAVDKYKGHADQMSYLGCSLD